MGFTEPEAEISCYSPPLIPLEYPDDFLQCVRWEREEENKLCLFRSLKAA
jgi:hypothetical protein